MKAIADRNQVRPGGACRHPPRPVDRLTVARALAYLGAGAWLCSVDTNSGEPTVMVLPLLVAMTIVLDLAASRRNSTNDAKLSRVVLTGWLTPVSMVAICTTFWAAVSAMRALVGWRLAAERASPRWGRRVRGWST